MITPPPSSSLRAVSPKGYPPSLGRLGLSIPRHPAWLGMTSLPFSIVRPHQAQDPVSTKLANTLVPLSGGEETEEEQIEIESPVQALTSTSSGTQEFPPGLTPQKNLLKAK